MPKGKSAIWVLAAFIGGALLQEMIRDVWTLIKQVYLELFSDTPANVMQGIRTLREGGHLSVIVAILSSLPFFLGAKAQYQKLMSRHPEIGEQKSIDFYSMAIMHKTIHVFSAYSLILLFIYTAEFLPINLRARTHKTVGVISGL